MLNYRFVPLPFPVVLRLFPWIRSCHDDIPETDVGVEVGKVGDAAGNTHKEHVLNTLKRYIEDP